MLKKFIEEDRKSGRGVIPILLLTVGLAAAVLIIIGFNQLNYGLEVYLVAAIMVGLTCLIWSIKTAEVKLYGVIRSDVLLLSIGGLLVLAVSAVAGLFWPYTVAGLVYRLFKRTKKIPLPVLARL